MKIFLPITLKSLGGTSTFARKLHDGLQERGHTVTFSFEPDYDVLLVSPRCAWKYIRHAKQHHKPIIHRLDGVYYPATTAGWKFPLYNLPLQAIRWSADFIVYQSEYSRHCCNLWLGPAAAPHTVIYNGVDNDLFSSNGKHQPLRDNDGQHVFITASRFRRPDQITPLVESFQIYRQRYHANSKFVVAGNRPPTHWIPDSANIEFTGPIANAVLPQYLRAADVFLFSHQNPPCPNNVIEAMAAGLPICGVADGAMPELINPTQRHLLLPAKGSGFWRYRIIPAHELAEHMHQLMQESKRFSWDNRNHATHFFSFERMISQYLHVLQTVQH